MRERGERKERERERERRRVWLGECGLGKGSREHKNALFWAHSWCSMGRGSRRRGGGRAEGCRTPKTHLKQRVFGVQAGGVTHAVLHVLVRGNTRNTPKRACFLCSGGWGMLGGFFSSGCVGRWQCDMVSWWCCFTLAVVS